MILLLKQGTDLFAKSRDGMIPYDITISNIHGKSCFLQAFNLKSTLKQIMDNYNIAFFLMPDYLKLEMIEGAMSPRTYKR